MIVYDISLKNTRMSSVVSAIDNGGAGSLNFGTSSGFAGANLLATFTFNATCGTVSGGVLTFSDTPLTDSSAANSGTAAEGEVLDGSGHIVISGLVIATSDADIIMSSVSVTSGQSITLTSASITHG